MKQATRGLVGSAIVFLSATAFIVLATLPALAGPTPADKCEAAKNKIAGSYYSCREKAEATAITKATPPDYSKCSPKFDSSWDKAETTGAGDCPDTVLTAPMNTYLAAQAAEAASVVAGAAIPACAADFSSACGDLATCQSDCVASVRPPLSTGQTFCYDSSGTVTACLGTGHDGELQKGAARSFTDNGNGTITDNTTGLMWEKLSDDNSIHDKDNLYSWAGAFAGKAATLNSTVFAGHADWRVPNLNELETLKNLGAVYPATYSAFNTACPAACTVLTCSCTQSDGYWSSTTYQISPSSAWSVYFNYGYTDAYNKTANFVVRAVRAGS